MRSGNKSDLLSSLDDISTSAASNEAPSIEAVLLGDEAIVNMLKPGIAKTFLNYSKILPYVIGHHHGVDIVWDVYLQDSLKATTRGRRGEGIRRRVLPDTKLPENWQSFLISDCNETEMFKFLAMEA